MVLRKISFFAVIMISCLVSVSQTMYQFEYNFHKQDDSSDYKAFFVLFGDGSAMARVRFAVRASDKIAIMELNMQERQMKGMNGTSVLPGVQYVCTGHRQVTDYEITSFDSSIAFIFMYDSITGYHEPKTVVLTNSRLEDTDTGTSFSASIKEKSSLRKGFVQQYFLPGESFYQAFAVASPRGEDERETTGARMFLLAVANIYDAEIGNNCKKDMERMVQSFSSIGNEMGFSDSMIIIKTISGVDYNKKNIVKAINELKPTPNKDIVVFYYSGHGFRKEGERNPSQFPYIDLRTKSDSNYYIQSLNMETDIFNRIIKKKALFNLVLGDCCNINVPAPKPTGRSTAGVARGSEILLNRDNCKSLFMGNKPLSILACAADRGQLAISNPEMGGFFSYFFKNAMDASCSIFKRNPTWQEIMKDTQDQTVNKSVNTYCNRPFIPENICKSQLPIVKIIP